MQGVSWSESYDMDHLDEGWEESGSVERLCDTPYPLQHILIKFLDTRAPLPGKNERVSLFFIKRLCSAIKL